MWFAADDKYDTTGPSVRGAIWMERPNPLNRLFNHSVASRLAVFLTVACFALPSPAQQLEPRRWSHLPMGINFAGGGYVYTSADISFDPVLLIEDVTMEMHSIPFKYIRTFELLGKSARVDVIQSYQDARWSGLLDGAPASTARSGWSDLSTRFAVNLIGAPPLSSEEFANYRATTDSETIVGLGLIVQFPTGHYLDDKLLNLGSNRFTFRPQLGVVRTQGKWATEVTVSSWVYTDNNEFFNGNQLDQMPFYTVQGHVDYTFRPGLWVGAGIGYGIGGESRVNGVRKNDRRENLAWVLSFGYPINPKWGAKIAYIGNRRQAAFGADSDSVLAVLSVLW
jgi:hypothetical protein